MAKRRAVNPLIPVRVWVFEPITKGLLMSKITEWKLEDNINTKDDLMNLVWAAVDDMPEPITKEDFDYLIHLCKDVLRIAKLKGWIK